VGKPRGGSIRTWKGSDWGALTGDQAHECSVAGCCGRGDEPSGSTKFGVTVKLLAPQQ
jgi:hypothetical protein